MFLSVAYAAPAFVGTNEDVSLAHAAWTAGVECAGIEPDAHGSVPILRDLTPAQGSALAGLSNWGDPRGVRIRMLPDAGGDILAHEVAHAWLHGAGLGALIEGRTQLLAACMQRHRPGLFDGMMDVGTDLARMPDLRTWRADPFDTVDAEVALDGYAAAFRLFRALALVVPPERLYASGVDTWEAVRSLVPPSAAPALAALDGGVEAQRAALRDEDLDGNSLLYETFAGTDPHSWDTDGDGWWDGAPATHPPGAIPIPRQAEPICFPSLPAGGGALLVELGGQLAGLDVPPEIQVDTTPWAVLSWRDGWSTYPGGLWVRLVGDDQEPNPQCAMQPGVTIRSVERVEPDVLGALAVMVDHALEQVDATTGLRRPHVFLTVKGSDPYLHRTGNTIQMSASALAGNLQGAAQQVAVFTTVLDAGGIERGPAAAALLHQVFPSTPGGMLDATPFEIRSWTRAIPNCATGWAGVLGGACEHP